MNSWVATCLEICTRWLWEKLRLTLLLFSALPYVGKSVAFWLWGGFSIDNATLNRFFSFHYLLPFLIAGLAVVHLSLLHLEGSSNPLGICSKIDKIAFYPYFYLKDLFGLLCFFILFGYFLFFYPNLMGHPDNYIENALLLVSFSIVSKSIVISFQAYIGAYLNRYSKFRSRYRTAIQSMSKKQFWSGILVLSFYKWLCKLVGTIQTKLYLRRFNFIPENLGIKPGVVAVWEWPC